MGSAAAAAFKQVGEEADRRGIEAFMDRLKDDAPEVRMAAANALGQLAEKGDNQVINALVGCLSDSSWQNRQAAVKTLGQAAEKGDEQVINALSAREALEELGSVKIEMQKA